MNSVAYAIAPSLKYWPKEKLPSISKNVRWYVSRPTSSMSGVRKHFCTVVTSSAGGGSRPRKYGICGCIPADVSSVERSSARGISDADGRRRGSFDWKKERNPSRISADVCTPSILGAGRVRPGPQDRPRQSGRVAKGLGRGLTRPRPAHLRDDDDALGQRTARFAGI